MAGKKYAAAVKNIDPEKHYALNEALKLVIENKVAKLQTLIRIKFLPQ